MLALRYAWRGDAMVTLHNLADRPVSATIAEKDAGADTLVSLLTDDHARAKDGKHRIDLEPYGYRWYRVGGLAYLLQRRPW